MLKLIFPPRCAVCDGLLAPDEGTAGAHRGCLDELTFADGPACMHCGRPLAAGEKEFCHDCGRRSLRFARRPGDQEDFSCIRQGKAVFVYEGAAKRMMYRFKYKNRREIASFLADCACERFSGWMRKSGAQAVVPVPMYRKKERHRGYNQAGLFGRAVAERMGLVFAPDAVIRVRDTRPQKDLDDMERKNNLKRAFQADDFVVQYRSILLVDDIYTTGSTAESVAKELRRAGAGEVYFLAVCIGRGFQEGM